MSDSSVPHDGGKCIESGSDEYQPFGHWIVTGMPFGKEEGNRAASSCFSIASLAP